MRLNVDRGLFEKDKLVFSFMLCVDIMKISAFITNDDWNFFIRGPAGVFVDIPPKPAVAWLQQWQWTQACTLSALLPAFKGIEKDLTATPVWVQFADIVVSIIIFLLFSFCQKDVTLFTDQVKSNYLVVDVCKMPCQKFK